jgi:ubiquinone/menaquinone biosynthesis C-methylase UbiE
VDYRATVDFYFQILEREGLRPRTAVDLACGTGSVAVILAEKGLRVIGVDMSEEMLTVAQQKAMELPNPP